MRTKEIPINCEMLKWARKEANLSLEESVLRAKIGNLKPKGDRKGVSACQRLEKWEDEKEPVKPTFSQLKKLAKAYQRPILTFFLKAAPKKDTNLKDYRTIGDGLIDASKNTPEYSAFIRKIEALHKNIKSIVKEGGGEPLKFLGSADIDYKPVDLVAIIRKQLGFSFENQQKITTKKELFYVLREKAESLGIFIIRKGNLGTHHTNIKPNIFRGLAICDPVAPMVVVNPNDWKAAMVFTLIHELTHLWIGRSGITNIDSFDIKHHKQMKIELFCNRVAAEFLVPETYLRQEWQKIKHENLVQAINELSLKLKVSVIVIARRMADCNLIGSDYYWKFYNNHISSLKREKEILHDEKKDAIRIPATIKAKSQLGKYLVNTVMSAVLEGRLPELDASQILNVKINKFSDISPIQI